MHLAEQRVRETVESAFDGVPRPGTSLLQFQLIDQKGMAGTITDEEWRLAGTARTDATWQDISDLEIEHSGCQLAHMQADAFRYYLPAYLLYVMGRASSSVWESAIHGFVVFALTPSKLHPTYTAMQYGLLNARQHEAIAMFLEYMASNADDHCRRGAERALAAWKPGSRIAD